jgi:hypothetical protein
LLQWRVLISEVRGEKVNKILRPKGLAQLFEFNFNSPSLAVPIRNVIEWLWRSFRGRLGDTDRTDLRIVEGKDDVTWLDAGHRVVKIVAMPRSLGLG